MDVAGQAVSSPVSPSTFDAQLGAIYLNNEGMLNLVASYAFTDRSGNFNHFRVGEGMIGQADPGKGVILLLPRREVPPC